MNEGKDGKEEKEEQTTNHCRTCTDLIPKEQKECAEGREHRSLTRFLERGEELNRRKEDGSIIL